MPYARATLYFLLMFWFAHSHAETISVAVAANFTAPMKELVAEFELASGHQVNVSFASTGKLFAQIQNGAPFQAFFSADQTTPQKLEADAKAVAGSQFTYATGALALWSPRENFVDERLQILRSGQFKKLALANPKLAPYGAAAVEVLENLRLKSATEAKWVQGENIAQTYQFVFTGNTDLGFVALSQIMEHGRISTGSYWLVPDNLHLPLHQDAQILLPGEDSPATHQLMTFVTTAKAKSIMASYGYKITADKITGDKTNGNDNALENGNDNALEK